MIWGGARCGCFLIVEMILSNHVPCILRPDMISVRGLPSLAGEYMKYGLKVCVTGALAGLTSLSVLNSSYILLSFLSSPHTHQPSILSCVKSHLSLWCHSTVSKSSSIEWPWLRRREISSVVIAVGSSSGREYRSIHSGRDFLLQRSPCMRLMSWLVRTSRRTVGSEPDDSKQGALRDVV